MYDYAVREVPFLRDHAAALKHHNSITPLKSGPSQGHRPIGARRKTYQRIWLTPTGDVKITEGWREHYTNVEITYYGNGMITVVCPNGSARGGSLGFLSKVLGIEVNERGNRLWVHGVTQRKRGKGWDRSNDALVYGSFPLMQGVYLRLQRQERDNPANHLVVQDPVWPTVRTTDRKGAKQVRAIYREFIDYLRGFHGILDGSPRAMMADNEISALTKEDVLPMALSGEPQPQLRAALWLTQYAESTSRSRYRFRDDDRWVETKRRTMVVLDAMILDAHPTLAYRWQTNYDGKVYKDNVKLVRDRG